MRMANEIIQKEDALYRQRHNIEAKKILMCKCWVEKAKFEKW